ncbi:MAG: hypothetical protein KDC34_04635 [Saprospiraceae bacterium]|nr:hypothetical protein [Saprospiraceae bacterium]
MGRSIYSPWPFVVLFFALVWFCQSNAFFWDTVQLSSKHAHWYYENHFSHFFLPNELDSGHPPTWGMYLALCWQWFGQSLPVSHWAVFPFLTGICVFGFQLAENLRGARWAFAFLLLLCLDPVLLGQAALVSPDLALVCFFLMTLSGIFREKRLLVLLGIIGLCIISMRGMITAFGLFLFVLSDACFLRHKRSFSDLFRSVWAFLPGGLLGLAFLIWHYIAVGWIGYHENSPWAESFSGVDFQGFIKNVAVIGWRFLDFGRLFLFLVAAGLLRYLWLHKQHPGKALARLALLFVILLLVSLPGMLLHVGLSGHRYLLPLFISLSLLLWYVLGAYPNQTLKNGALGLLVFAFLTGHFWIYPRNISQQWDATLAHIPYYGQRKEMILYLHSKEIPIESVGTVFPNAGPFMYRDLNGETTGFPLADLDQQDYIYYSNVMNDFSDEELRRLFEEWELVYRIGNWPVETCLFKRK